MTVIVRVHYKHSQEGNLSFKNTYFDVEVDPNKENIKSIEIMKVIPEHNKTIKHYKVAEE